MQFKENLEQQTTATTILRISVIESEKESVRQTDNKKGSQTRARAEETRKTNTTLHAKLHCSFILST